MMSFAIEPDDDDTATEVQATITGIDNSLARAQGYATAHGDIYIYDDNHIFNKSVEVWALAETWLTNCSSGTANGIPDWYLYAKAQLWVSNGDITGWITSDLGSAYDATSATAQTRAVNAKDGGKAEAQGFHNINDYYGTPVCSYTSSATERF